jgi:CheY-like chemotaxis protein
VGGAGDLHDLNNMLAAIIFSAAILQEEDAPATRQHAARIAEAAQNAADLVAISAGRCTRDADAASPAEGRSAAPDAEIRIARLAPKMPRQKQRDRKARMAPATTRSAGPAHRKAMPIDAPISSAPAAQPAPEPAPAPLPASTGAAARLDGLRILLVEDDACLGESTALWLRRAGATVEIAASCAAARAAPAPDLLICDQNLPDGLGHNLIRHLRWRQPELPVHLVSGDPGAIPDDPELPGAVPVRWSKPLDMRRLLPALGAPAGRRLQCA